MNRSGSNLCPSCFYVRPVVVLTAAAIHPAPGDPDGSFTASVVRSNDSNLPILNIRKFVRQPDGKFLVAGSFRVIGKYARDLLRSTEGFAALPFGINTDIPIPNAFVR